MCSKESENNHETESSAPGSRLCDAEGPQHQVKYMAGSEQKESLARLHTKYFYDENAPGGETYNLVTRTSTLAELANEEEVEVRKTTTSYSGQSNLGWKLRAPTSVTVDPEGKKLTTTTLYNSSTGQITETRAPAGSGGGSAHDTKLIYYTSEANTEGYSACGSHPEYAGLLCETLPAKQPESGGLPKLPVTVTSSYNIWNEPLVATETFGSTVRTKTRTYDGAGRLATNETTSTANTALPKVTNEYNSKTGVLEKQSTTVEGKTTTITSKYNTLGQPIEYTDADGNIAKYRYAGPENDWLLEEMTDGSNAGTGKQTYTYNSTTKLREELWDSAAGTFTVSYDAEGKLTSEVYPNAMCANNTYNSVGETTHIEYIKTSNCSESGAPVWYSETRSPSVRGTTFSRTSTLAGESYAYDTVGRLTETHETPSGEGCTTRLYAYDEESNRTSQTTRAPGGGGACATEGGTVLNHTYDEGNRLTDSGIAYDSFGNVTKLPAADAEGHELSSTFYVDNAVATQSQNGVTDSYYLDPEGRVRETVSGANTTITHYNGAGSAVAWTSETGGKSTRNIPGIDGTLSATQTNEATPVLQLHDLQGDVVATAALSTSETKLLSTYNSTEFGVPNAEKAPPKFAWLGAADVASAFSSGVITYGATSYVPQTGRALQSEAVEPPGAPQGSGAGAAYTSQEEPWVFQGAAAEAAEAPGLEAAREQAALEAALAAATDPLQVHYMNKTKARGLAEKLWALGKAAEVAEAIDVPLDWVEAAVGVVGKIAVSTAVDWLVRTSEMMWKCGNSKWSVVGVKANICKLEYSVLDVAGTDFVDFTKRANVFVCLDNSGKTCFHQVYPDPPQEEIKCAFGIFCIADVF
jgi:YD repeat-containing protein